jgi:hypothetical protein
MPLSGTSESLEGAGLPSLPFPSPRAAHRCGRGMSRATPAGPSSSVCATFRARMHTSNAPMDASLPQASDRRYHCRLHARLGTAWGEGLGDVSEGGGGSAREVSCRPHVSVCRRVRWHTCDREPSTMTMTRAVRTYMVLTAAARRIPGAWAQRMKRWHMSSATGAASDLSSAWAHRAAPARDCCCCCCCGWLWGLRPSRPPPPPPAPAPSLGTQVSPFLKHRPHGRFPSLVCWNWKGQECGVMRRV